MGKSEHLVHHIADDDVNGILKAMMGVAHTNVKRYLAYLEKTLHDDCNSFLTSAAKGTEHYERAHGQPVQARKEATAKCPSIPDSRPGVLSCDQTLQRWMSAM